MSIAKQVRQELARLSETPDCCASWELKVMIVRRGYYAMRQGQHVLRIAASCSAAARRLFLLLRRAGVQSPLIMKQQVRRLNRNHYLVEVHGRQQVDALLVYLDLKEAKRQVALPRRDTGVPHRQCCRRAYARGAFISGGSISLSGSSGYHLEISCDSRQDADACQKVLSAFNLQAKIRDKDKGVFVYLKNVEAIADFLRIIGAGTALLDLESKRVVRSLRNRVNRLVNFETANLDKVVASAHQQLAMIESLGFLVGLDKLPAPLQQAARARIEHPNASLKELGEMLDPPVSKSTMNHRFRRLGQILEKASGSQETGS